MRAADASYIRGASVAGDDVAILFLFVPCGYYDTSLKKIVARVNHWAATVITTNRVY